MALLIEPDPRPEARLGVYWVNCTVCWGDEFVRVLSGSLPDQDPPAGADPDTPISSSARAAFTLALVDHTSQIVVALRMLTVSPHFTQALRREALQHFGEPLTERNLLLATMAWRDRFSDIAAVRARSPAAGSGADR